MELQTQDDFLQAMAPSAVWDEDPRVLGFIAKHGDLEAVRKKLSLSKKEISQLLWVDPSAWTRWTRGISRPPANIYRSLSWYFELLENQPERSSDQKMLQIRDSFAEAQRALEQKIALVSQAQNADPNWSQERRALLKEIESKEKLSFAWKALLLICLVISILNLVF